MAEAVVSVVVETLLGVLAPLVLEQVVLPFGVRKQLGDLKDKLSDIQAVLSDAEEQERESPAVKNWLTKLKDAVNDADDLLDQIATEELRSQVEGGSVEQKVYNFFSSFNPLAIRYKIGHRIKNIMERLDEIATSMRSFHFLVSPLVWQVEHNHRETHSFEDSIHVIGRDHERETILGHLLSSSNQDVTVIAIVGIGGLGKTTVARLVYNDYTVAHHFDLRMWARVSENFDLKRVTKKVLKSATNVDCGNLEMDQLQNQLRDSLRDQRFLLVLDDVWNEKKDEWDRLKELLTSTNGNGSKIIVTTRSQTVCTVMSASVIYHLEGLSESDCWWLFKKCAFQDWEDNKYPKLEQIGMQIMKKCGGVPLMARTLGGMLYSKTEERDWLYVQNNDICRLPQSETDILPALTLSYYYMPSYLKQCFGYCSLFPKGYLIHREHLIQLWMAQGYIRLPESDQDRQLEDIGNMYFNQLLSRCFFHVVDEAFDSTILTFRVHDLVLDLAEWVAGTECHLVKYDTINFTNRFRHISYLESKFLYSDTVGLFPSNLRTLLFPQLNGSADESSLVNIISRYKYIRVMDLSGSDIEKLPNSIGELKHLRYLDVSGNRSIQTLPGSTCKLYNLQTLKLSGCERLEKLPKGIGKLIKLRHLDVTSREKCWTRNLMSGLTSLQTLFIAKCDYLTSLSEVLQHLTSLRKLRIVNCKRLASLSDITQHLTALENLVIWDCPNLCLTQNDMEGIKSLRSLDVGGIPMLEDLPQGLQHAASTLQYLSIAYCHGLTALPDWLGNLTLLQRLEIVNCPNLKSLPPGVCSLTALQVLVIVRCPDLEKRCTDSGPDRSNIAHIPQILIG